MQPLNLEEVVRQYVEQNINTFHQRRLEGLKDLKLAQILKRKNPYLFKTKNILTAEQLIKGLLDAHLSSSEETIFGDWLEGLATFICQKVYGGFKSGITGIDIELVKMEIRYIISVKSSPHWGNSSQKAKMMLDFKNATKVIRANNSSQIVVAVNGCCYGVDETPDKGDYFKYCGQRFWEFISGDSELYIKIIEPLGNKSRERNDDFMLMYAKMINKFTKLFIDEFCDEHGEIVWERIVRFNSASEEKELLEPVNVVIYPFKLAA